jgi:hypothetical protein
MATQNLPSIFVLHSTKNYLKKTSAFYYLTALQDPDLIVAPVSLLFQGPKLIVAPVSLLFQGPNLIVAPVSLLCKDPDLRVAQVSLPFQGPNLIVSPVSLAAHKFARPSCSFY